MLNIFDLIHRNKLTEFLKEPVNKHYRNIYRSIACSEFITKCIPVNIKDVNIKDMITTILSDITFENRFKKKDIVYKSIKTNTRNADALFSERIDNDKLYQLSNREEATTTWMFQEYATEMIDVCAEDCEACEAFKTFTRSNFNEMFVILERVDENHLIRFIMNIYILFTMVQVGMHAAEI